MSMLVHSTGLGGQIWVKLGPHSCRMTPNGSSTRILAKTVSNRDLPKSELFGSQKNIFYIWQPKFMFKAYFKPFRKTS